MARIEEITSDMLIIKLDDQSAQLPEEIQIAQTITTFQTKEVFQALTQYWTQFWQRGPVENDSPINPDGPCLNLFRNLPQLFAEEEQEMQAWKLAISSTKTFSAPGCDGISIQELRMLPDKLLKIPD